MTVELLRETTYLEQWWGAALLILGLFAVIGGGIALIIAIRGAAGDKNCKDIVGKTSITFWVTILAFAIPGTIILGADNTSSSDALDVAKIEETYDVTISRETAGLKRLREGNTDVFITFPDDPDRPFPARITLNGKEAQLFIKKGSSLIAADEFEQG